MECKLLVKAKPKRYQPPAGVTNFFQQLPKETTQTSSNWFSTGWWSKWKCQAQKIIVDWLITSSSKAEHHSDTKFSLCNERYSDTAAYKRKAISSLVNVKCERTGTDIPIEENRCAIEVSLICALQRLQKQCKIDKDWPAVTTTTVGGT